jgi:cell division protein FtsZ
MASGKRASMREGPLAALFRKTEEGQETQQPAAPPPAEPPSEPTIERRVEARTPTPQ